MLKTASNQELESFFESEFDKFLKQGGHSCKLTEILNAAMRNVEKMKGNEVTKGQLLDEVSKLGKKTKDIHTPEARQLLSILKLPTPQPGQSQNLRNLIRHDYKNTKSCKGGRDAFKMQELLPSLKETEEEQEVIEDTVQEPKTITYKDLLEDKMVYNKNVNNIRTPELQSIFKKFGQTMTHNSETVRGFIAEGREKIRSMRHKPEMQKKVLETKVPETELEEENKAETESVIFQEMKKELEVLRAKVASLEIERDQTYDYLDEEFKDNRENKRQLKKLRRSLDVQVQAQLEEEARQEGEIREERQGDRPRGPGRPMKQWDEMSLRVKTIHTKEVRQGIRELCDKFGWEEAKVTGFLTHK